MPDRTQCIVGLIKVVLPNLSELHALGLTEVARRHCRAGNAQLRSPFLTVTLAKFTFPPLGLRQLLLHSKKKAAPASGCRVFRHIRIPLLSRPHLSRQPEAGKGTPPQNVGH